MASTVQAGGGSGVDLSELTSGERLLIGLLDVLTMSNVASGIVHFTGINNEIPIDYTRIKSITVSSKYLSNAQSTWGSFGTSPTILNRPTSNYESTHLSFWSSGSYGADFIITAFTTTDGKVHTASNLNY